MSDLIQISDFSPYLQQTFQIRFGSDVILPAELIAITELPKSFSPSDRTPFNLVFRTEQKGEYYPQGVFVVQHPEKGDLSVFLVPMGPDTAGMRYEAVFS